MTTPPVQPLLWRVQSLVPTMLVSRRLPREGQPGSIKGSALRCLSRMRGNSHVRFLERLGGRKDPLAYSVLAFPLALISDPELC